MSQDAWDREYVRKGMPSSFRDEPSGVLRWTLNNWSDLTEKERPKSALDVGCGTGRNAVYMALQGIKVLAFDLSAEAIAIAQRRGSECAQGREVIFAQHDLASGIQARSGEFDLVSDIFVYKHQMSPDVRRTYRSEVKRVLSSAGRFLVSLAERDDGYYSGCPDVMPSAEPVGRPIMDPVAGVGSVLFDLPELVEEMSDCFRLEMSWHKMKAGMMHGKIYVRRTLATIWAIAETENVA